MNDLISRQAAIGGAKELFALGDCHCDKHSIVGMLNSLPSVQPEEVIPHRNYKYLSDYWCKCGWHLGKKGSVKYCSECGRKVNWDE